MSHSRRHRFPRRVLPFFPWLLLVLGVGWVQAAPTPAPEPAPSQPPAQETAVVRHLIYADPWVVGEKISWQNYTSTLANYLGNVLGKGDLYFYPGIDPAGQEKGFMANPGAAVEIRYPKTNRENQRAISRESSCGQARQWWDAHAGKILSAHPDSVFIIPVFIRGSQADAETPFWCEQLADLLAEEMKKRPLAVHWIQLTDEKNPPRALLSLSNRFPGRMRIVTPRDIPVLGNGRSEPRVKEFRWDSDPGKIDAISSLLPGGEIQRPFTMILANTGWRPVFIKKELRVEPSGVMAPHLTVSVEIPQSFAGSEGIWWFPADTTATATLKGVLRAALAMEAIKQERAPEILVHLDLIPNGIPREDGLTLPALNEKMGHIRLIPIPEEFSSPPLNGLSREKRVLCTVEADAAAASVPQLLKAIPWTIIPPPFNGSDSNPHPLAATLLAHLEPQPVHFKDHRRMEHALYVTPFPVEGGADPLNARFQVSSISPWVQFMGSCETYLRFTPPKPDDSWHLFLVGAVIASLLAGHLSTRKRQN